MSSLRFKVDMEDIHFVLFEQLDIDTQLKKITKYADFDQDTYESMLSEAQRIAEEVLAPINGPGDRGCRLEGNDVKTPPGFKEAWQTVAEGGWIGISADPEVGGAGLPPIIGMVVNELFAASAMAFWMYPGLTAAAARILVKYGPEGMRGEYAQKMFTGEWGGTMCLTEAGAGSSVGDNRCRALPADEPGVYLLEGEKIFISGGDQDLTENIVHLVLARTPDAPPGTKGLSLFLVPKFLVNPDLSLGERNDARVVGIEHKMGINGSATCTLALGANGPCRGWLVGEEYEGIKVMFEMMNEARIGVASQGQSIASAGFQFARQYVHERIQGQSIENFRDAAAPKVAIVEHPDVRRMLMFQKVHVETMRSALYRLGMRFDQAEHAEDPAEKERLMGEVELLVPVLKGHCSDMGFEVAVTALQCFGGYGYIGEYPIEQTVRDAKILSIYEGTNGIQAMDLLGRKLRMKGGALFMEWMQGVQKTLAQATEAGFGPEADAVGKALNQAGAAAMHLGGLGMQGKLSAAMYHASPFLRLMGVLMLAVEAVNQALVAKRLIDEKGETPHLAGKVLNLKFYVGNVLPQATALAKSIQSGDDSALDPRLFQQA